jgi:expansin (peptidoglycan-binding protein)
MRTSPFAIVPLALILFAACGSDDSDSGTGGSSGVSGSGGVAGDSGVGGASGDAGASGTGGSGTGGTTGGTGGSPLGGTGGSPAGGTGGSPAGGTGGASGASGGTGGTGGDPPEVHTGEGTFYDADGSGNCSFDPSPHDLMVAAMNQVDYAGSAVCGGCILVSGPLGSITVRIVDRCPECAIGDVDLSAEAFAKIANPVDGRVPIEWYDVPCDVTGPIVYKFKEGSNQWWTAIQVRNSRWAVASLEVKVSGSFVNVQRENYNYFVHSGLGPGPYEIRVTDIHGSVLNDTGIPLGDGSQAPGSGQFP